ncbi:integrator complex subunit 3 [Phalaenopsis equestris]|uniref:integrator complex subunit 3 n=1 Tax=Phalaenopsis equestris TaxID=78828 RepID=UPI0009E19234|nr:integrator complex subunit 3 [Phalaenopsis equestris]
MSTTSKLLRVCSLDAENPTDASLREAFSAHHERLKPPFPLTIPAPSEYSQLNLALVYGILTEPGFAKTHLTHLHALVTDGYNLFTTTLINLSNESYTKLLETPRSQLLWISSILVKVAAVKVETLMISLLRQIKGGDFSEPNLWLCAELIGILVPNWDWLVEEPLLMRSSLFVFLRLLADHYRLVGRIDLDKLKKLEIEFCIRVLREHFDLCLGIGRDVIRLLQDLVYIPEFKDIWNDFLSDPLKFGVSEFMDISYLYRTKTPPHYLLLRITPDMETQLRFLLTRVKWGCQKRYQAWFAKKHFCTPGSESLIIDIVRFICCVYHPSNEIIQSNVISRWAVIGWLLKCCRKNYYSANLKLALFYDWLFFDEKVDNIMNIEPAMLLMWATTVPIMGRSSTLSRHGAE